MATINMVKTIKKVYPNSIVMVKIGNFYYVYDKDSFIFSYLFDYKIKDSEGYPSCAFPLTSFDKITSILKKTKLNYVALNKANDFEELEKQLENSEETYIQIYKDSEKVITRSMRIQNIYDILMAEIETDAINDILFKIEQIIKKESENSAIRSYIKI